MIIMYHQTFRLKLKAKKQSEYIDITSIVRINILRNRFFQITIAFSEKFQEKLP